MAKMVMGIQVIPQAEDVYGVVDRAIEAIRASGLRYEVTPMETVVEGELDELLDVARRAHRAALEAGARSVQTHIKLAERGGGRDVSVADIMARYR
ncbi:MAG: thiamine-binding protein [Anaerolineae bacterium]|nr:thiamine-binding protein [Anaerolineae bacterium]